MIPRCPHAQLCATPTRSRLKMFHAKNKPEKLPDPCVLLTTYSILAERKPTNASASGQTGDQALATQAVLEQIRGTEASPREWALMVLDEVNTWREGVCEREAQSAWKVVREIIW